MPMTFAMPTMMRSCGFGRSAKENSETLDEIAGHFGQTISRLIFLRAVPGGLSQPLALKPALSDVPRAENLRTACFADFRGASIEKSGRHRRVLRQARQFQPAGAKVLIVDDDIRNIYSLTSVLETYDIKVLHAERGRDGIALLNENPDVDVALIDIMMPEMDGYETMRQICNTPTIAHIPLISVTAKAMKGDRQKCLDAGASDYIAKPVDLDLLLALLRVWIGRARSQAWRPRPNPDDCKLDYASAHAEAVENKVKVAAAAPTPPEDLTCAGRVSWPLTTTSATFSPSARFWREPARLCARNRERKR